MWRSGCVRQQLGDRCQRRIAQHTFVPFLLLQLRNVLEFDGGIADTAVLRAGPDADTSNGTDFVYRPPPACVSSGCVELLCGPPHARARNPRRARAQCRSFPQACIPQGPTERAYDIKYFPRDVRRSALPGDALIDASFGSATSALLARPSQIAAPKTGSPGSKVRRPHGMAWRGYRRCRGHCGVAAVASILVLLVPPLQNPDVERYDATGLRSAMTATHAAVARELRRHRPNHLAEPVWVRRKRKGEPSEEGRHRLADLRRVLAFCRANALTRFRIRRATSAPSPQVKDRLSTAAWLTQQGVAGAPADAAAGRPAMKRLAPWQYTQVHEW